ncbi:hypothetical protein GCM10028815_16380 [Mariniluteicoccus flavus]
MGVAVDVGLGVGVGVGAAYAGGAAERVRPTASRQVSVRMGSSRRTTGGTVPRSAWGQYDAVVTSAKHDPRPAGEGRIRPRLSLLPSRD